MNDAKLGLMWTFMVAWLSMHEISHSSSGFPGGIETKEGGRGIGASVNPLHHTQNSNRFRSWHKAVIGLPKKSSAPLQHLGWSISISISISIRIRIVCCNIPIAFGIRVIRDSIMTNLMMPSPV